MAINILVIDDDRKMAERLMRGLQRADKENVLGEIQVDDSVIKLETVENYDISHFETTFDVALIDYQLSSSFTGILVSAWIALYLQIPRLTLTTASYPGNPAYFNGSILKNEITDSPEVVIQRILECVENYNSELWLAKQHQELVAEYQHMLDDDGLTNQEELKSIEHILDRFEKSLMHIRKSVLKEPTYTSKQKMSLLRNSRLTKKNSLNFMRNSIAIWRK